MTTVVITEAATGQTAFVDDGPFDDVTEYMWSEGNFSCDCNRLLFFIDALGLSDTEDSECSDGKFWVTVYDDNGKQVYNEIDGAPETVPVPWGPLYSTHS